MPGAFDRTDALAASSEHLRRARGRAAASPAPACALDAAAAGLRTALVERDDFASGTSSKSSKLVHGGLRYLQQGEVRLVYEALASASACCSNAPHLVKLLPFLIPMFTGKDGVIPAKLARALGTRHVDATTSPAAPASASSTSASTRRRGARPHADAAPRAPGRRLPLLRRRGRRRPPHASTLARTAALDHGAVVANDAVGRPARARTTTGRVAGVTVEADGAHVRRSRRRPSSTPPACGPTTSARSTRAPTPTRSARPRASTSPCRGSWCATTSPRSCPCRRTSARSSSCRGATSPTSAPPTPTTTARSTTRSAPPRTSTTCCETLNCVAHDDRSPRTTSSARGPGCARW